MDRSTTHERRLQRRGQAARSDDVAPGRTSSSERLAPTRASPGALEPPGHRWTAPTAFVGEEVARAHGLVQFDASRDAPDLEGEAAHALAAAGFDGGATGLPHLDAVQRSFGRHEVSGVRAYVGGAAARSAESLGANAYASGDQVAFAHEPDLFLAAHEAAHVVQQRGGVQLSGGLGQDGDEHERHADAVAAAVVAGRSAEPLLDRYAGGAAASTVQRQLREVTRRREVTVARDYDAFEAEVVRWISGQVSSRRAPGLVEGSNLRDVHARLVAGQVGRRVTLSARLIPGASQYERIEFAGQDAPGAAASGDPEPAGEPRGAEAPGADAPRSGAQDAATDRGGAGRDADGEEELDNATVQRPDLVCEQPEPDELTQEQRDMIRAFTERAHQLIAPWARQRNTADLRFDDAALQAHYRAFTQRWLERQRDNPRPVAFEVDRAARAEARRLLDAGTFRAAVREIQAFNHNALGNYAQILELGASDRIEHRYRIEIVHGEQVGAGELVNGEVTARAYRIHYTNDMGMQWNASGGSLTAGAGPGVSTIPIARNVELGGTYEGTSRTYFSSDDFHGATIYYITAGGQATQVSVGVEQLVFRNHGRELRARSTSAGLTSRVGTDAAGSASVMTGGGMMGVTDVERPNTPLPAMEDRPRQARDPGQWTPMIASSVFFRTQEDTLDDADRATIRGIAQRMLAFDQRHPGALYRIESQGRASRRWRGVGNDPDAAGELNTALAQRRAEVVNAELQQQLGSLRSELTAGVQQLSDVLPPTTGGQSGPTPDDNRALDRSVVIRVSYNQCGDDGRVPTLH